jgi:hypothetical protein
MAHAKVSPNCHIAQVAGGWWADLLCLGELVDPGHRRRALKSIDRLNVIPVPGCPANEAAPDGSYSESWPAYALAYYAAQAIAAGLADEGWRAVERIVQVYEADGSFWDTPLEWAGEGNREPQWGRWYMSNPASLYLLLALSGIRLDLLHRFLVCTPSWPTAWGDTLRIPAFLPGVELEVICERKPKDWSLIVHVKQIAREPLALRQCISRLPAYLDPGRVRMTLSGIPDADVGLEDDRRIVIRGAIRLSREGDGFELSASAA